MLIPEAQFRDEDSLFDETGVFRQERPLLSRGRGAEENQDCGKAKESLEVHNE